MKGAREPLITPADNKPIIFIDSVCMTMDIKIFCGRIKISADKLGATIASRTRNKCHVMNINVIRKIKNEETI